MVIRNLFQDTINMMMFGIGNNNFSTLVAENKSSCIPQNCNGPKCTEATVSWNMLVPMVSPVV